VLAADLDDPVSNSGSPFRREDVVARLLRP
jgi:hypothetical protein